jgi:hypothetical protein
MTNDSRPATTRQSALGSQSAARMFPADVVAAFIVLVPSTRSGRCSGASRLTDEPVSGSS